jgi:hypothetical protein
MTAISKRYNAAHKTALNRVAQHLKLAKAANRRGMSSIAECAKVLVESNKLGKAAEGDRLASALAAAHGNFGKAADELADAQAHLNQALTHFKPEDVPLLVPSGYSRSASDPPTRSVAGATAIVPSLSDLTEGGDVPQYDSVMPRPTGKVAAAFAKMMTGEAPGRHVIGKPPMWR